MNHTFLFVFSSFLHQIFHDVTITLCLLMHTVNNRLWELRIPAPGGNLPLPASFRWCSEKVAAKQQFTSHQGLMNCGVLGFYSSVKCSYGSLHGAAGQHSSSRSCKLIGTFWACHSLCGVGNEFQRWGSVRMELIRAGGVVEQWPVQGRVDPFCEQVVSLYSLETQKISAGRRY